MYKLLTKNGQLFAFGFGALLVILTLVFIFTGIPDDFTTLAREDQLTTNAFNFAIYVFIGLIIITVILMFGFGIFQIFSDLKGSVKGLAGIGAIIVVYFIARAMGAADTTGPLAPVVDKFNITEGVSVGISGAITTVLVMLGLAVAAFLVSEVRNFFK